MEPQKKYRIEYHHGEWGVVEISDAPDSDRVIFRSLFLKQCAEFIIKQQVTNQPLT